MEIESADWIPDQNDIVKRIHRTDVQVDAATAMQWGIALAVVVGVAAGALDALKKNRVRGLALSGVVFASGVVMNKTLGVFMDGRADKKKWLNSLQK